MRKIDEFDAGQRIDLRLLENSIHYLDGEIDENSVGEAIRWILYENLENKTDRLLTLYINSTGGDLYQAFALMDVIRSSPHTIRTVALGSCMSAAFLIFASGDNGERYASKNTSFMCHQFTESMDSKYHDLKATMKENDIVNQRMIDVLKNATGLAPSKIKSKLLPASDVYLTAEEVLEFGIADHIV